MGWWTLSGDRRAPLAERVVGELNPGKLLRAEERQGYGETTVHLLYEAEGSSRPVWVVALVRSDNMVKIMDESCGPYCAKCSPEFLADAVRLCGEPNPAMYAGAFRERMAA